MNIKIAEYKFNSTIDTLPSFNEGLVYEYSDIDNGDGTITRTIIAETLPTYMTFYNCTGLLEILYLNIDGLTSGNWMFGGCGNLTAINTSNMNTSRLTDMSYMFYNCTNLTSIDVSNFDTSNVTNMSGMFTFCNKLTSIDVSNWDTDNVTTMYNMFGNCQSLTSLDVSNWNTSNVSNMSHMFRNCNSLTSLDVSNWNVSNVTNMANMFAFCNKLTTLDVSNWDTGNVIDMSTMFNSTKKLTSLDVSNFDTSKVTTMYMMFQNCRAPELDVSNFDTSNVTNIGGIFNGCINVSQLDVSKWDVSNVTNMSAGVFGSCRKVTELDLSNWNTGKVTVMNSVFSGCSELTTIGNVSKWDVSNVTDIRFLFNDCTKLTSLNLSGWNTSKVTNMNSVFNNCSSIEKLNLSNWTLTDDGAVVTNMFAGCTNLRELNISNLCKTIKPELLSLEANTAIRELNLFNWSNGNIEHLLINNQLPGNAATYNLRARAVGDDERVVYSRYVSNENKNVLNELGWVVVVPKLVDAVGVKKIAKAVKDIAKAELEVEVLRATNAEAELQAQIDEIEINCDNKASKEELQEVEAMFDGKSFRYVSQAEYDMLSDEEKNDPSKTYFVIDAVDLSHDHENKEFLDGLSQEVLDNKANKEDIYYDTRELQEINITFDGDATDKEVVGFYFSSSSSLSANGLVKISNDVYDNIESVETVTVISSTSTMSYYCEKDEIVITDDYILAGVGYRYVVSVKNDGTYELNPNIKPVTLTRGTYIYYSNAYSLMYMSDVKLIINNNNGELSVIDEKYLINSPGRYQEGKVKTITTDKGIEKVVCGECSEIFNSEFNIASGTNSHAEGYGTKAIGASSHAEGSDTDAIGNYSHSEGVATVAKGSCSHAEGSGTQALGDDSHVEGLNTIASGNYQHVQGQYNLEDTENKYAHIVGNGNYRERSNAHTLDWDGNAWFAGKATVSVQPTDNNDLTTKLYVDNAIAEASIGGEIDTSGFALKTELFSKDYNDLTNKPEIPNIEGLATETYVDNNIKTVSDELAKQMDKNVSGSLANGIIQAFDAINTDRGRLNNHDAKIAHFESQLSIINGEGAGSIKKAVSDIVDAAPTTLDTLNELAQALGDDPNFATTVSTELGKKINTTDAIQSIFYASDEFNPDRMEYHSLMKNNKLISPMVDTKSVFWHGDYILENVLDEFDNTIEQKADKSELVGLATEAYVNQSISQTSEDLQNQINELFQNVSSGKELIASAITDKGVDASEEETFQSLSEKINQIPVGPPGSNIIGYINENNDIYVSLTELESGTYTLKFEDYTGLLNEFDDIGTVEV